MEFCWEQIYVTDRAEHAFQNVHEPTMSCHLRHCADCAEVLLHERGGYMEGGHMEQRLNRAEAHSPAFI